MMNPARADDQDDLFTTGTAGLPEVRGADVIRLDDGTGLTCGSARCGTM
jgi:hypothetical protein